MIIAALTASLGHFAFIRQAPGRRRFFFEPMPLNISAAASSAYIYSIRRLIELF